MKIKLFILSFIIIFPIILFSGVTSIEIIPVGNDADPVEANSINNPVFHLRIYADTEGDTLTFLSVKNVMNNPYGLITAKEPDEIVPGSCKLWYMTFASDFFDEAYAQYVTHLAVTDGNIWANTFNLPVGNNYDIWVTVDIQPTPTINRTLEFQSNGISFTASTQINSFNEPSPVPFLMTTNITPGNKLEIFHQDKTVSTTVALGEENFIPMEISFYNASGNNSADILIGSITITVKESSSGSIIIPNTIISYIEISDKYNNEIFGSLNSSQIPNNLQSIFIPMNNYEISVPANTTITVNVKINVTKTTDALGKTFILSLESANDIKAYDIYTFKKANVYNSIFDSFPMTHNTLKIIGEPNQINSWYKDLMPSDIYKGMINVPMLNIAFENPGNTLSASVLLKNLNVRFFNLARKPVMPKLVFSKISLTNEDGTIVYDSKVQSQLSAIENIVTFTIPQGIEIAGSSKITLTVKADILSNTNIDSFLVSTLNFPQDIICYVVGTTKTVYINSFLPLPYESSIAVLTSSFRVSVNSKMPQNLFVGQKEVEIMDIIFSSPITASGSNTILAKGMTLTATDITKNLINFSDILSKISIKVSDKILIRDAENSPFMYFDFPEAITVTSAGVILNIKGDINENVKSNSIQIQLSNTSNVYAYADFNPNQKVFIMPEIGYSFPMTSGIGVIAGEIKSLSFTNYPNPFKYGSITKFSYYLNEESEVTIKVFDVTGRLIKTIINKQKKSNGAHSEDFWDGKDEKGRFVISGTYFVKIETNNKSEIRKITFMK